MRILAISLDLDDTLWPIQPVIHAAEQHLDAWLKHHHAAVAAAWPIPALRALRERIAVERPDIAHDFTAQRKLMLEQAFAACGIGRDPVEPAFEVFYAARNRVDCYPDVGPALSALAARLPLASISNGNADLQRIGLRAHFRHTICARQIGMAKPAPAIFHAACARLGIAPEHMLHVGDDPALDIEGARAAGLRTAWLNRSAAAWSDAAPGIMPPDLHIRDLAELVRWIEHHT
ncbi:MAG: HAD family hydrolase [Rhodanobacter sp.]|jgi:putative hydrolase of the HAD superfamily|nr:HAD family hydrolase [Rhodanobacter sp.]